eukprot:CAMPEP_0203881196 /NCGR_PEP_ID=MMETSP0359-20131031/25532_1 /ASSEMBLY_ACC=CAM_ASM_000338 /TAXON_ID=268821 /ORGANISM="Scrippsiella Hangoei, Strain SHTV-5" /LENGTH=186 /DNA_ID=CAMNT_0050800971 /DNA_START=120 /DNA_END=683 /DNA_ORIENTATION=+
MALNPDRNEARRLQAAQKPNSKSGSVSRSGPPDTSCAPPDRSARSLARPAAVPPTAPGTCWRAAWPAAGAGAPKRSAEVLLFRVYRWQAAELDDHCGAEADAARAPLLLRRRAGGAVQVDAGGCRHEVGRVDFDVPRKCEVPAGSGGLESDRLSRGAFGIVAKSSGMLPNDNAIVEADDVDNDVPH